MASRFTLVWVCLICQSYGRRARTRQSTHDVEERQEHVSDVAQRASMSGELRALSHLMLARLPSQGGHTPVLASVRDNAPQSLLSKSLRRPAASRASSSSMRLGFGGSKDSRIDQHWWVHYSGGGGDDNIGGGGNGRGDDNGGNERNGGDPEGIDTIVAKGDDDLDEEEDDDDEDDDLERPKKVLIVMSDTGGGHKASGKAIVAALKEKYGDKVNCTIVDIWTDYGVWPFNSMVPGYQYFAKHPNVWRLVYYYAGFPLTRFFTMRWGAATCYGGIQRCLEKEKPDMIVSVHPLCQHLPLRVSDDITRKQRRKKVPLVTVVTDLAECHLMWFHKKVDEVIVPSEVGVKLAQRRGFADEQIHQIGLPIRPGFKSRSKGEKLKLRSALGLDKSRTALVVGGGDGIGRIEEITKELATELSSDNGGPSQLVVVCGKNEDIKSRLEAVQWPSNVRVVVKGFVSNMDELMGAADCIVTKAGPGTIAEACASGLPIMLSAFLPGQEAGNVPYVVNRGIGAYSPKPSKIAQTVSHWLRNPPLLAAMSAKSHEAGRPDASRGIADRLGKLLFPSDEDDAASNAKSKKE